MGKMCYINQERGNIVAAMLRDWMAENPDWVDKVVGTVGRVRPGRNVMSFPNTIVRKVGVSGEDIHSIKLDRTDLNDVRSSVSKESNLPLKSEWGNFLVGHNGNNYNNALYFCPEEADANIHHDLYFMNPGDMFFNHPVIINKLDLVEILKRMLEKRLVTSNSLCQIQMMVSTPLLTIACTQSVGELCFLHLMSLSNTDCNVRCDSHDGKTLLMHLCKKPKEISLHVYRMIVQHPSSDLNTKLELPVFTSRMYDHAVTSCDETALHFALENFQYLDYDGEFLVNLVKILIDGGADPSVGSEKKGNACEYFATVRASAHLADEKNDVRVKESHYDEIERALHSAVGNGNAHD